MTLRATLAALLAVLLLSGSCAASACEVACDLGALGTALGTGCHQTSGSRHRAGAPVIGTHCGAQPHRALDIPAQHAQSGSALHASPCRHAVCAQQPQILEDRLPVAAQLAALPHAVFLTVSLFIAQPRSAPRLPSEPPLRTPLLAFLQTTLRV